MTRARVGAGSSVLGRTGDIVLGIDLVAEQLVGTAKGVREVSTDRPHQRRRGARRERRARLDRTNRDPCLDDRPAAEDKTAPDGGDRSFDERGPAISERDVQRRRRQSDARSSPGWGAVVSASTTNSSTDSSRSASDPDRSSTAPAASRNVAGSRWFAT